MPTRVKICGITREEDAVSAVECGADAIGLNLLAGPRKIEWQLALSLCSKLKQYPFVSSVALVGPQTQSHLLSSALASAVDYVQAYETRKFAEAPGDSILRVFNGKDLWTVYHIGSREDVLGIFETLRNDPFAVHAQAFVFDTASKLALGGTGQAFDWNWIAEAREAGLLNGLRPIILAGGLTPENVADAIRIAKPYAVDVSSGVEVAGKVGVKDPIKIRDFIQAVRSV